MPSSLPSPTTLLMVCSERLVIEAIQKISNSIEKINVEVMPGIEEVCLRLGRFDIGLVVIHIRQRHDVAEVAHLLQTISAKKQTIATLVLGDDNQAENGLALLRLGAADYLSWPNDLGRLAYLIEMLTVRARFAPPALEPATELIADQHFQDDSFLSLGLEKMLDQVRQIAAAKDTTVLLGGETGTGKSRLARLIHELSPGHKRPFFTVNCGTLSASLIESELFGHVKGAFTGADRDRVGKFAEAGSGTLLLDDIDGLPLVLQPKLLRAVEERSFEPLGTNKSVPIKSRLIAASNCPLEREVAAGKFRPDLYFRLNVAEFFLPPLRERAGAVRALAGKFIAQLAANKARPIRGISQDALQTLENYHWPGNIRELRNVLDRAVTFCPGPEIRPEDLPPRFSVLGQSEVVVAQPPAPPGWRLEGPAPASLAHAKDKAELARILAAIENQNNNRARVAAELGVSRNTLYKKLRKYGLMAVPG